MSEDVFEYENPTPAGDSRKITFATANIRVVSFVFAFNNKGEDLIWLTIVPSIVISEQCFSIPVDSKGSQFFHGAISKG